MEDLYQLVNSVINECDAFLQMEKEFPQRSDVLVLYFQLIDFRRVYEYYDENFITWYAASQEDCRVRIFCMNRPTRSRRGSRTASAPSTSVRPVPRSTMPSCWEKRRRRSVSPCLRSSAGNNVRSHPQCHLHPLSASPLLPAGHRPYDLSQRAPKAGQLHHLLPQLSLYGRKVRPSFSSISRHARPSAEKRHERRRTARLSGTL
ncbi:MAG: hypothetical protein ACLVJ6_01950 [Merdibacter sp.]